MLIDAQLNSLREHIKCCCEKWPETCFELEAKSSLKEFDQPNDNNYPRDNKSIPEIKNGFVPIIITNASIGGAGSNVGGIASKDMGATIRLSSESYVLAHELGHSAGFVGNDPEDRDHDKQIEKSSDDVFGENESLMSPKGGGVTPEDWCRKMHDFAKKLDNQK